MKPSEHKILWFGNEIFGKLKKFKQNAPDNGQYVIICCFSLKMSDKRNRQRPFIARLIMAVFRDGSDDYQRLDYALLQNGSVSLYFRPAVLAEDVEHLKTYGYRIDTFDCAAWQNEEDMFTAFATTLNFPDYFGRNLDALNDCLCDIDVPEESG